VRTLLWCALCLPPALGATATVPVLKLVGSINPGTGDYFISEIEKAETAKAPYVLVVLDSPGGLLSTTRLIVQKMLESTVPIVVFVAPQGARLGSAGTLIALAADVAAMAPGTNMGAARPESNEARTDAKLMNDAGAFAENIAKTRGRDRDWAVKSVRENAPISAEDAFKQGLVDAIAENPEALATQLPGFRFKAPKGNLTQIPDGVAVLEPKPIRLKFRVVSFLANPNLAYLVLCFASACFWIQLSIAGVALPGAVGVFCFLISMASFQLIPISYGALGLILVGLSLLLAELLIPAYGLLGIGGTLSFIVGSLFLMDTTDPEFQLSVKTILPTAAALVAVASTLGYIVLKRRRASPLLGVEELIGQYAEVKELVTPQKGKVFVQGELWNAFSTAEEFEFSKGSVVVVQKVEGTHLIVGTGSLSS
jgi:membrane-bound serine protease (ClpP class)